MKVPMVSKVSEMLKAKIVMSTKGILETSAKREGRPAWVKIAPKVVGSCWQASVKLMELLTVVTPIGIPITAVATIPIRIAPGTLHISRTMVRIRPITKQPESGVVQDGHTGHVGIKGYKFHI